ncbi:MAG TPA: hypothetical protein VGO02_11180 [Burkholderiales bacterium]|jgi:hypothetical protein|nr:hypothetical protein [Burkholderiales bacterium]
MRPDLAELHAAARRQRAIEIHRLIFLPIAAFFRRPSKKEQLRVAICH